MSSTIQSGKNQHSISTRIFAHLQLLRPANILTATADILAGFAISGATVEIFDNGNGWFYIPEFEHLLLLVISTIGLYGGGVVLNDFFDAELDKAERPERPIPSGRASKTSAFILGVVFLSVGIQSAAYASQESLLIAAAIASLAVLYNGWGKHKKYFGPLNMGLCRGGNLLLGISAIAYSLTDLWYLAAIPVVFIAAITTISRGEVQGDDGKSLRIAGWLYALVLIFIAALAFLPYYQLRLSLPFLVLFAWMIYNPLRQAQQTREPKDIGKAVKFGVLSLILMDAAIAAGFTGWDFALLIVLLLPLSMLLARVFAVT